MDMIEFMENMLDIKLLDYQKEMIEYIEEHPDYKIIFPRGRISLYCNRYGKECEKNKIKTY